MASSRPRREVWARSPSQSDMEDIGSDSDYSPGSLMIDMGNDDTLSSAPSSSPLLEASPSTTSSLNKNRKSVARRRYNTESNRMVFTGVKLLGQMSVVQSGHAQPLDRLDLYAYGWGDFFLDIIARRTDSFIPVKNIYEKVIPGLKRNVLSARISKLQVKSEALSEPYISAMKKLGLVVTGASHFVGIVDFIKICKYFHVQPPDNLTKFYAVNSEVNPDDVLRTFSSEKTENQALGLLPTGSLFPGSEVQPGNMQSGAEGSGGAVMVSSGQADARPDSRGTSSRNVDQSASPQTTEEVDIRRVVLSGGVNVSVVVRAGEPYLLKVELPSILPSHSRDVLETIRRTYGITVQHASKAEIGVLKSNGVVGGKAGRCALFSARDVCRMFHHWKTMAPQPLQELAEGKLPKDKLESSDLSLPFYSPSTYTFRAEDPPLPSFPSIDVTPALHHSSTSSGFTAPINPLDLPLYTSPQQPPTNNPRSHQTHPFLTSRLSHPPPVTSSPYPISSLTPDQFQRPVQMLNSLHSSSFLPPPSQSSFSSASLPPFSTIPPPHHGPQSSFSNIDGGPLAVSSNYTLSAPQSQSDLTSDGVGSSPVVSSNGGAFKSVVKVEPGVSGGRRRMSSSSGPPLDDQELEFSTLIWGDSEVSLLCPPEGAEPYIAISELVDKIFHNRAYVSAQRRNDLGIVTLPATSLQIHALRARGSLDAFTGNTKLVSLSGAVKLAAVSNIQIPGTVIQTIRKYCKEPLESIITPAGFAPATHPPSSQPSQSHSYYLPAPTSQPSHSSRSSQSHTDSPSRDTSHSATGGKTVPQPASKSTAAVKQVVRASNDESAASVSPLDGVPQHPDLIDPGPHFTNTVDGTYCLVKWGQERLALLIGSQRVHYMGLYQVFQTLFKQYVTRMNFKMRMRKLEIKSIRAASSVRQALINLNALPQSSPVCGLIRVSEVERLARSYGVEPPQVLYDVFLLQHSDQKQLPNHSRSAAGQVQKLREKSSSGLNNTPGIATNLMQSSQGLQMYQGTWENQSTFQQGPEGLGLLFGGTLPPQAGQYVTSQSSSSHMHSVVITTSASDKNALMVSVPRQSLTSRFRLVSRPVAPPGVMSGLHSSRSYPPPTARGSVLHSLAKKISQKSRKLGKGKTSGVGAMRYCPKCHYVSPPSKKRCVRCGEFLVGRTCPECGTLNHNRTRECFRCNAVITAEDGQRSPPDAVMKYMPGNSEGEGSISPQSPLSPHFSPPPIRNAALKSMFPQDAGKAEDSAVVTKTMFSGNLASSRKCVECGQLNSKMAKKCLQCRSPLQGRPCPQCNRPNHSHSTECYKCGHSLPCTATKWVYVGSNSNRIYRSQESANSSRLSAGLKNRATTVCLRCDRLRNSGQFTCGRCGDMYWTKPITPATGQETDTAGHAAQHSKKRKTVLEPNWNIPSQPDPDDMLSFASNLLCLDIGEGLLSLVNDAETKARETVHQAEEELEGLEEEYQTCAQRREEKEGILNDAHAELEALIADVERQTQRLTKLKEEEENAKQVTHTHPDEVSRLREKIECVQKAFSPSSATSNENSMDTTQ